MAMAGCFNIRNARGKRFTEPCGGAVLGTEEGEACPSANHRQIENSSVQ
jgi:hypothetical protein